MSILFVYLPIQKQHRKNFKSHFFGRLMRNFRRHVAHTFVLNWRNKCQTIYFTHYLLIYSMKMCLRWNWFIFVLFCVASLSICNMIFCNGDFRSTAYAAQWVVGTGSFYVYQENSEAAVEFLKRTIASLILWG